MLPSLEIPGKMVKQLNLSFLVLLTHVFNEFDNALRSLVFEIRLNPTNGCSSSRHISPLNLEVRQIKKKTIFEEKLDMRIWP